MIQLASDPNASRPDWRAALSDGKAPEPQPGSRGRPGHAWPFISRYADRPGAEQPPRPATGEQGS